MADGSGPARVAPGAADRAPCAQFPESIVAHLPGAAFVCDRTAPWAFRYVSVGCRDLTGYGPGELVGNRVAGIGDLIVDEDQPRLVQEIAAMQPGDRYTVRYRLRHRDGTIRWVWEQGVLRGDGLLEGVMLDTTARALTEERRRESEQRYRDLVELSPDPIVVASDGVVTYTNPAADALLAAPGGVVGMPLHRFAHPDDVERVASLAQGRANGDAASHRFVDGCGFVHEVEARAVTVTVDGEVAVELILRDVTERIRNERIQAALQTVFEMIATATPLPTTLDAIACIVEERLPGRLASIMLVEDGLLHDAAAPALPAAYRQAIDGAPIGPSAGSCGTAAWRGEPVAVADIATDPLWAGWAEPALEAGLAACWSLPIRRHDGTVGATFGVYAREPRLPSDEEWAVLEELRDLTAVAIEHTSSRAALERGATTDDLTGLPNRRTLRRALREALGRARSDRRVATLFIDLDDFKDVNDSLGHAAGDEVLRQVAALLTSSVRDGDVVARFSGDEFVVCAEGVATDLEVEEIIARLQAALDQHLHIDGQVVRLRASIGVATSEGGGDTPERLLSNADAAMYRAKDHGRGGRAWFDQQLRDRATRRLEIEAALGPAIETGAVEVRYQPKVRLADGVIVGVEALARWRWHGGTEISPTEFITVAEATGLIVPLGAQILRRACADAAAWQRVRPDETCTVAVNVSARQLRNQSLVSVVRDALAASGLPPHLLCLEVTESSLMEDSAAEVLHRIRALGVHVAIDDFGTGYSSLSYLKRLPVDQLKIDRSFVAEVGCSAEDVAIVAAVIAVADAISADVVAEGVEGEGQADTLAALGCRVAQGFLWSPAVPADHIRELLHRPYPAPVPLG
jgi:diguanylate cyclase (GGDEF)-like protein/PAS domain S-box-containing protein